MMAASSRRSFEWRRPREQLIQDAAKGEDVGALVELVAARLLGRHIRGRSEDGARARGVDHGRGSSVASRGDVGFVEVL
jgi:hypothetical protein